MESRAKLFGHPIHPMLIPIPLGAFTIAAVYDTIYAITGAQGAALTSFWVIAAGIVGGLAAAAFGLIDWLAIPKGTRARRVGLWHALVNVAVVGIFGANWLVRWPLDHRMPPEWVAILSVVGVALGVVGGWLGGELVDRLGVGVDDGAHLNAPSSLSKRPATATAREVGHAD